MSAAATSGPPRPRLALNASRASSVKARVGNA
jgi:hypothetical protein